ncbi:hypothetical protein [[Ruminococcus] torques]|uniref:hypothetical protein n=1 Tax=[Ruminococcus] torques TaxID=33039 RepID=UPI0027BABF26|nr:hypothetical protein [[Ruminococcus] torques]
MKKMLLISVIMIIGLCSACGKKAPPTETHKPTDKKIQTEQLENNKKSEENNEIVHFSTDYIPFDYMNGYTIIKKSKETKLFGLLDENGETILEPEYDKLDFTVMNDQQFIKADFEGKKGIFSLNGSEYIPCKYADIVSAGDIGWLAENDDGQQVLLNEKGNERQKLTGQYTGVLGNRYLYSLTTELQDGEASDLMLDPSTTYYDLNENLLSDNKEREEKGMMLYSYTGIEDLFFVIIHDETENFSYLYLADIKGKNAIKVATGNDFIREIYAEDHIVGIEISSSASPKKQSCLSNGLTEGIHYFDLEKKEFVDYKPNKVVFEEVGNFYKAINPAKETEIDNKIQEIEEIGSDDCYLIEDVDSQVALIDNKGNILIPFGNQLQLDGSDFYYNGKEGSKYCHDESFAFHILNDEGQYEIYGFNSINQ